MYLASDGTVHSKARALAMAAGARELRRSLASYDWIGFDLDHCLARYNQARCYPLIYGAIRSFVVEHKDTKSRRPAVGGARAVVPSLV